MRKKVAVTTSSFGQCGFEPLKLLEKNKFSLVSNPQGRTLRPEETLELLEGCLGVIAGTEIYSKGLLEKLNGLRVISRCGSGKDNIDLEFCKKRKIKVFNTPDTATRAVAELVIGLILNLLRHIHPMDRDIRSGTWHKRMGRLFEDKEMGIVGFGQIGQEVARLSHSLGAKVFYYDVQTKKSGFSAATKNELKDLLSHCDIISLHLPFSPQNRHFIGRKEFSLMKKGTLLINCSRGGIVDEKVLYQSLKNGRLAGAALDVFDSEPYQGPLRELENVILTPHIGSYAKEARLKMELAAVHNLINGLRSCQ